MVDDRTALMSARALSPGYEILWYTVERVLGQGGFGITYLATDRNLDRAVAIKEYLPTSFAYRHQDYSVKPITGDHRENFIWGLGSFLKEAQTLARFSHPNIVRVHSVFEQNETAYMVMEYEHGQNLSMVYKHEKQLDQAFFEQIFFPIFDGLKEIHKFDFIHRDIKPANIYIREDGTPVLIDFGSARQTTQQQTSEITTLVSQGYTPLEQYSANYGDQGPWTDIYALAATIYQGIVGKKPEESLSRSACLMRSKPDLLEPLDASLYPGFSQRFLDAVFAGLKLEPEGRPQSLEEWSRLFELDDAARVPPVEPSGFTQLESDHTRIQPRKPVPPDEPPELELDTFAPLHDSSGQSRRSDSKRLEPTGRDNFNAEESTAWTSVEAGSQAADRRNDTDFLPDDKFLDFSDDDVFNESSARSKKIPPSSHVSSRRKKGGNKFLLAAVAAIAVLGAGVAYFLFGTAESTNSLSLASLNKVPRPTAAVETRLPEESAQRQLQDMLALGQLLSDAYQLNPADEVLLNTISATESQLLSLAKKWNASQHDTIASSIRAVSDSLPAAVHDQVRIQGVLSASGQVSSYSQVLALLEDGRYLLPAGDSVLDRITAVSATDYEQLQRSAPWQTMMSELSSAAMDKLGKSEFYDAARLTEAALTIDRDNAGFIELRAFLQGS